MDIVGNARPEAERTAALGLAHLIVDLAAIRRNYHRIAAAVAPAATAAVLKADAYGLGAEPVARALWMAGCRTFFVADLKEALSLRAVRLEQTTVFALNGLAPGSERLCVDAGVLPVLNSLEQVAAWREEARRRQAPLGCALQVDTGMSRLGIDYAEALDLATRPSAVEGLDIRLLISQLACADEPGSPSNLLQLSRFDALAGLLPGAKRSLANSAGCFLGSAFHHDLVRPGLALYGVSPLEHEPGLVEAVVRVEAPVIQTRALAAGEGVGYGLTGRAAVARRLATVGIGYADGWPRSLGQRGAGFFRGVRLPIVGRVSMDSVTLDVTALPENSLSPGDSIQMIGPSQSLADVAADAGTVAHEIMTGLGRRLERHYRDAP